MNGSTPFIVGCPRSGTTLVRAMLDSHPHFWIANEPGFILPLVRRRHRYGVGRTFQAHRLADGIVRAQSFRRLGLSEELVRNCLESSDSNRLEDAIRSLFAAAALDAGKRAWGLKNPNDVLHIRQLAGAFPEARFIHVIRDGRDVALSLRSLRKAPTGIAEAALYWQRRVQRGRRAGQALPVQRYIELRYEDLIADPVARLHEICDFLEIKFHEGMLAYHRRSAEVLAGNAHPELHRNLQRAPTAGIRDWRKELSPTDARMFEWVAGRLLQQLGYEISEQAPMPVRAHVTRCTALVGHAWQRARGDALDRLKAMGPSR